jgi:Ran GTPase-activating protein (RanGAP) involved in mRNA processing and transport
LALKVLRVVSNSLARFEPTEINVSDNAMGAKGVDACKELLKSRKMQKLYVCNDGLSAEASELLAEILLNGDNGAIPSLVLFHFYNNMGGNGAGVAIGRIVTAMPELQDLRFSATRCGAEGCMAIATSIGSVRQLKRIDLSDNNFGTKACERLAHSLKENVSLHKRTLNDSVSNLTFVFVVLFMFSSKSNI